MFYIIDKDGKIVGSSTTRSARSDCTTIEKDFTAEELEKVELGYFYIDGELVPSQEAINNKIAKINEDFDRQIDAYLSKYSKNEITAFTQKKIEALIVLDGWESAYISGKAKAFGITPKEFASVIIAKNEEYTKLYIELENKKDLEIQELKNLI